MASWIRAVLTSTLLAFCIATPSAQAGPAPVVFDFEDGLQGWELGGTAQRVQTQVLGGEWAIFSEGGAIPPRRLDVIEDVVLVVLGTYIFLPIDITDIASVSLEQRFVGDDENGLVLVRGFEITTNVVAGNVIPFVPESPGNPSLRTADVSSLLGGGIYISWADVSSDPSPLINAFIDNITFHPVPEPSALLLLSTAIIGLALVRVLAG